MVVGAAAGIGRWLCRHLFSTMNWDSVVLIDTAKSQDLLHAQEWEFSTTPSMAAIEDAARLLARDSVALCLAVPRTEVPGVAATLLPGARPDAVVFDTSSAKAESLGSIRAYSGDRIVFGTHPLFSPTTVRTLDGQTIVVSPNDAHPDAHEWFAAAVTAAGGIVRFAAPEAHDGVMAYVETMAQQTLLGFADAIVSAGLDLEADLWASRTPLFETLLGLATNVLSESQQDHVRSRQLAAHARRIRDELEAALARGRTEDIDDYITALRDRFSGSLFETIQGTANAALSATQSKKAELSRHNRTGDLVGIIPVERPDTLRVGRIVALSPTTVTLEEVMVGESGQAALLIGAGAANAARLGRGGKPRLVRFGLGRIDVAADRELDGRLDEWLAYVRRDVRFLVPESVAGAGVLCVVAEQRRVRNCTVISEVVRTGQRAVVIRLDVRADADVDDMVELLRERVSVAYAWPEGLSLPADAHDGEPVRYLGPAGTFSEAAAQQCIAGMGLTNSAAVPVDAFDDVIAAAVAGGLGVVPVASSASGLVERTATALLDADDGLTASGVVDVPVRFDAITHVGRSLHDLRGAQVLSHPQALEQCSRFLRRWGLVPTPCASTADACRLAAESPDRVAIVRAGLDLPDVLRVAEREIDDIAGALTRFLVIGRAGMFGELIGGSDPTLRSLWIAASRADLEPTMNDQGPAFDEIITSPTGKVLLVTSRGAMATETDDLRFLGRVPWTPRTPLVRLGGRVPGVRHDNG